MRQTLGDYSLLSAIPSTDHESCLVIPLFFLLLYCLPFIVGADSQKRLGAIETSIPTPLNDMGRL